MTIQEMHIGVGVQLQQVSSYSYSDFQPEEIDYYINRAIKKWVRQKQASIMQKEGVPDTVSEDLYTIIKSVEFVLNNPSTNNGDLINSVLYEDTVRADLSTIPDDDFYLYLFSRASTKDGWKNVELVLPTEFDRYTETIFNTPHFRRLPSMLQEGSLFVLKSVEDDAIQKVLLTYIKEPATVEFDTVNSDLPPHVHDEIVDLTVTLMRTDLAVGIPNDG